MRVNPLVCITGIRLEPLCSFHLNICFGYEVLSLLMPGTNAEHFFRVISPERAVNLFIHQSRFVMTLSVTGSLTFNLPARALVSARLFKLILDGLISGFIIEIQDPKTIMDMSGAERAVLNSRIIDMKKRGVDVWLDDITPETVDFFLTLSLPVEGIKTDRSVLCRIPDNDDGLNPFIEKCRQLAPLVVMEGIETEEMKCRAQNAGAQAGQGFLWPEEVFSYPQ